MNTLAQLESGPIRFPSSAQDARSTAIAHVIVCLDRSPLSDACLPYARFVANAFAAKLTLLHVMPSARSAHEPDRADALEWEVAKREAQQYLHHAATTVDLPSADVRVHLTQGHPAEQIVAAARDLRADLTILSSHGEGGASTSELGSTAQRVLALGAGSVLIMPAKFSLTIPPKRILVALDGSMRSECVLPLVADLARAKGTEVVLVHVVQEPTATAVLSAPEDMSLAFSLASRLQSNAEGYLARIRTRLLAEVPAVEMLVIRRGEERQALLDAATQQSADLLVLTAHGSTCNVDRVFGSVASYLLAHAKVPVLVLQDMPKDPSGNMTGPGGRGAFAARPLEAE